MNSKSKVTRNIPTMDKNNNRTYSAGMSDDSEGRVDSPEDVDVDQEPEPDRFDPQFNCDLDEQEESENEYYSDFEREEESYEVAQEDDAQPLPPPYQSPRSELNGPSEVPSDGDPEDSILVFKSTTGPRLTIQPKKAQNEKSAQRSRMQQTALRQVQNPKKVTPGPPMNSLQRQRKQVGGGGGGMMMVGVSINKLPKKGPPKMSAKRQQQPLQQHAYLRSESQESVGSIVRKSPSLLVASARNKLRAGRQQIQASASISSCQMRVGNAPYNYRVKSNPYQQPPYRLGPSKGAGGNVAQRVESARRMTINDYKNRISIMMKDMEDLRKENRCLKVCQNRQNLALRKWEGRDAQLPRLLQQHQDEVKTANMQLKKALHQCREFEEKSRYKDRKIAKMEIDLASLRSLANRDNLKERNDLQEQVAILSANVLGCEKKIRQYMRHVEIMENNHNHQISSEKQKLVKAGSHANELRHEIMGLKVALRDKDRMLNFIQMRATGRTLLKSFQEKERVHNAKLNPAVLCTGGIHSPRSRSMSPHRNPISGRTYRAQSLDRPEDFSPQSEILLDHTNCIKSDPNSPRDRIDMEDLHPSEQCCFEHPATVHDIDTHMDQGDNQHQHLQGSNQNQGINSIGGSHGGGGGDDGNSFQRQMTEYESIPATGPTKNEYSKMSKMLEANKPQNTFKPTVIPNANKVPSSHPQPPPPPETTPTNIIPYATAANHTQGHTTTTTTSSLPWAPVNSAIDKADPEKRRYQAKPQPKPTFELSTGPKSHSLAKREMKLQRESFDSSRKPNPPEFEDDPRQRKKWEKVGQNQMQSRPGPVPPSQPQVRMMSPPPPRSQVLVTMMNTNRSEYSHVGGHTGPPPPPRQEKLFPVPEMEAKQDPPFSNMSHYSAMENRHSPRSETSTQTMPDDLPMSNKSNYSNLCLQLHSPRSERGSPTPPTWQEMQIPHQFQDYEFRTQPKPIITSPRETVPRGACSLPIMQNHPSSQQQHQQSVQVRGIYSIPLVGQHVIPNQPENLPQKCIFSYSNGVPHAISQQTDPSKQPMNLPFFSGGDGPQEEEMMVLHPPQPMPTSVHKTLPPPPAQRPRIQKPAGNQNQNQPKPITKQRSSTNQNPKPATKQASHIYNPSFFTKLGTWK